MTDEKDVRVPAEPEVPADEAQDGVADGAADGVDASMPEAEPAGPAADGAEASLPEADPADAGMEAEPGAVEQAEPAVADEPEAAFESQVEGEIPGVSEGEGSDDEAAMMRMLEGLPQDDQAASPDDINFGSASVSNVEFQQLQQSAAVSEPRNIELLMDVELPVSIELGRTKLSIQDILALGPGSVVELNKLAGEPADLLINYKVVARGEVVVVDENFGLRITQLMTPDQRLRALADE